MKVDMCNCLEDSHTQAALSELVIGEEVLVMSILMWSEASCLLYTSPSPRDRQKSRMPSSA